MLARPRTPSVPKILFVVGCILVLAGLVGEGFFVFGFAIYIAADICDVDDVGGDGIPNQRGDDDGEKLDLQVAIAVSVGLFVSHGLVAFFLGAQFFLDHVG
jgi:hypothetical protein